MKTELEITTTMRATPEQLAALFWNMGSEDQARFFAALAAETKAAYERAQAARAAGSKSFCALFDEYGTGQWYYLRQDLLKIDGGTVGDATKALMSIAAPAYVHWRGEF